MLARLFSKPDFAGVYDHFGEVPDEDPWGSPYWLEHSQRKLRTNNTPEACYALPVLAANSLGSCRVLDFGGGTGYVYYQLRNRLEDVSWHVVDSKHLLDLGRPLADERITFSETIPETWDLAYVNTTLQYIPDVWALLEQLIAPRPVVVLNRLLASEKEWVTRQTIGGRTTPCRFLSVPGLLDWFAERGYHPEIVASGAPLHSYARNIPQSLRAAHEWELVLRTSSPRPRAPREASGLRD